MTDPQAVRDATELLIEDHGLDGALEELQERHDDVHVDDEEHDRVITALGIVKRRRGR